jgi:hypothetical protein
MFSVFVSEISFLAKCDQRNMGYPTLIRRINRKMYVYNPSRKVAVLTG